MDRLEKKKWIIDLEEHTEKIGDVLKHIFNWIEQEMETNAEKEDDCDSNGFSFTNEELEYDRKQIQKH